METSNQMSRDAASIERTGRLAFLLLLAALNAGNAACVSQGVDTREAFHVLENGKLGPGLDLGVDSSPRRSDWVHFRGSGPMVLDYPAETEWGATTFLLGIDDPNARLTEDFSDFASVQIQLRGDWGAPQTNVSGNVVENGLAISIIGVGPDLTSGEPGGDDIVCSPPARDVKGRLCWLPPATPNDSGYRKFTIPLAYFDVSSGVSLRTAIWSPAMLVLGPNCGNSVRHVEVTDIALIPQRDNGSSTFCEERCPTTCVPIEPTCQSVCGTLEERHDAQD